MMAGATAPLFSLPYSPGPFVFWVEPLAVCLLPMALMLPLMLPLEFGSSIHTTGSDLSFPRTRPSLEFLIRRMDNERKWS